MQSLHLRDGLAVADLLAFEGASTSLPKIRYPLEFEGMFDGNVSHAATHVRGFQIDRVFPVTALRADLMFDRGDLAHLSNGGL